MAGADNAFLKLSELGDNLLVYVRDEDDEVIPEKWDDVESHSTKVTNQQMIAWDTRVRCPSPPRVCEWGVMPPCPLTSGAPACAQFRCKYKYLTLWRATPQHKWLLKWFDVVHPGLISGASHRKVAWRVNQPSEELILTLRDKSIPWADPKAVSRTAQKLEKYHRIIGGFYPGTVVSEPPEFGPNLMTLADIKTQWDAVGAPPEPACARP